MTQQALWHDSAEDALRALIETLGGPKAVGHKLYPEKSMDDARRLVLQWCSPERGEKPSLAQLLLLLKWGREAGAHVLAGYLMGEAGYAEPVPVDPRDEVAELQRAFMRTVEQQRQMLDRIQRAQGQLRGVA